MLWSDPQPGMGRAPSKRGVGVAFGADVTKSFLQRNNLQLVVRSHEVKEEGFVVEHDGCCITIFSAPIYCDTMGNKGAFIRFESDMVPHFTSFDAVVRVPAVALWRFYALDLTHLCAAAPGCATHALRKSDAAVYVACFTVLAPASLRRQARRDEQPPWPPSARQPPPSCAAVLPAQRCGVIESHGWNKRCVWAPALLVF